MRLQTILYLEGQPLNISWDITSFQEKFGTSTLWPNKISITINSWLATSIYQIN